MIWEPHAIQSHKELMLSHDVQNSSRRVSRMLHRFIGFVFTAMGKRSFSRLVVRDPASMTVDYRRAVGMGYRWTMSSPAVCRHE